MGGGSTCQSNGNYCHDQTTNTYSVCLPDWKQKADGSVVEGTGPAPDGDEDAIVGIILAVKAVENDPEKPSWYNEARKWADASATAFFRFNVDSSRGDYRLVKLGACWGGWDGTGNNPSYHSPGSYKAMRDFQKISLLPTVKATQLTVRTNGTNSLAPPMRFFVLSSAVVMAPWYLTGQPCQFQMVRLSILVDLFQVQGRHSTSTEQKLPVLRGGSLLMLPCIPEIQPTGQSTWIRISFVFVMGIPGLFGIGTGEPHSRIAGLPIRTRIFRSSILGCTTLSSMPRPCPPSSLVLRRMLFWLTTLGAY